MIRSIARSNGVRCCPAPVEPGGDALDAGHQVLADVVHHVVAEPLEQAHDRLRLAEQLPLLVGHEPLHPVLVVPPPVAAQRRPQGPGRVAPHRRGLLAEQRELALEPFGRYGRSHGCASNSNAWVVSWSAIQVRNGQRDAELVAVWRMFSSTNSRRPGVLPRTAARGRTGRGRAGP